MMLYLRVLKIRIYGFQIIHHSVSLYKNLFLSYTVKFSVTGHMLVKPSNEGKILTIWRSANSKN